MSLLKAESGLQPTLRLFLFITGVVFFGEALIMLGLPALLPLQHGTMTSALLDATLLSLICSIVILPLMLHLRRRAENAEQAINITDDGYWVVDHQGRLLEVNDGYCRTIGYRRDELLRLRIADLEAEGEAHVGAYLECVSTNKQHRFETRHRHREGHLIDMEVNVLRVGERTMAVFLRDITDRKRAEQEIHQLAFYDTLTRLPNRRLLMDRLEQALGRSQRQQSWGAVMLLDLDRFKLLNDTRGHSQGDLLLVNVAERLKNCLRQADTVARHGGDEFVIVLADLCQEREAAVQVAEHLAEKVRSALNQPFVLADQDFQTSLSIGITLFRGSAVSVDVLLCQADTAMYQAKKAGRNRFAFFKPAMQHALEARSAMEADLRYAQVRGQLELFYQPVVDEAGALTGAEALLRWRHPARGLVSPAEFIPLAEEVGLILPIGTWVLESACALLRAWQRDPALRGLQLAVNVSAHQFHQSDFAAILHNLLAHNGVSATRLKLELTESVVLENIEGSVEKMRAIQALGVGFAMDDFGTGHSSLTNLKRLPLNQMKIDQSFVRDLAQNASDRTIVRTIIVMADSLGVEVIAEGVETREQCALLHQYGCLAYQGYLFGRPMPLAEFEAYAREQRDQRHCAAVQKECFGRLCEASA